MTELRAESSPKYVLGECVICGETVTMNDSPAEMHDPANPEERGGVVHAECGIAKGWEVS